MSRLFSVFSTLLLVTLGHAETLDCTAISVAPYTISAPGIYCLTADIVANLESGNAITINANNVVLDLNARRLGNGTASAATSANGVYAVNRQNITIKNGTIRGFLRGIFLEDTTPPYTTSAGHVIDGIKSDSSKFIGIQVIGKGNIVRHCQVVNTGGSSLTSSAFSIAATGSGAHVYNNDVSNTTGAATGVSEGITLQAAPSGVVEANRITATNTPMSGQSQGIFLFDANGTIVTNNRIANAALPGSGDSWGIRIDSTVNVSIRDNVMDNFTYGVWFNSGATGKYMGNMTQNVTTPYSGGTAAGTTNY